MLLEACPLSWIQNRRKTQGERKNTETVPNEASVSSTDFLICGPISKRKFGIVQNLLRPLKLAPTASIKASAAYPLSVNKKSYVEQQNHCKKQLIKTHKYSHAFRQAQTEREINIQCFS